MPTSVKEDGTCAITLLTYEFHSLYIETSTLIKYHQFLESIITKMHVGDEKPLQVYANTVVWGILEKNPIFHAKADSIKDLRNGVDLTGTEGVNKRWQ